MNLFPKAIFRSSYDLIEYASPPYRCGCRSLLIYWPVGNWRVVECCTCEATWFFWPID